MTLWHIAWRYLWSRPLVTLLTLAGVALGAALISTVLTLRSETERVFLEEGTLVDMVVGAKGSPLQLVLSSVYHLDTPTGNIPWSDFERLQSDHRVRRAIPIGLGDNYEGFRIVGTTNDFFAMERRDPETENLEPVFEMKRGQWDFSDPFHAVLGSEVARQTGLGIGATFVGSHGVVAIPGSEEHSDTPYTVVGVLAPSATSNDRAIFTTIEAVWEVHRQEEELHDRLYGGKEAQEETATEEETDDSGGWVFAPEPIKESEEEVTAVLLQLTSPGLRLWMSEEIRNETNSMAAIPINEMLRLYQIALRPMEKALLGVAYLVVVVAGLSVLTTLYQAGERRRRDVAVMRSLGATPLEVFLIVQLEAFLISVLGTAGGWLLGHATVFAAAGVLRESAGLTVSAWRIMPGELTALGIVAGIGLVAGVIPAVLAYRRSPVEDLSGT